MKGNYSKIEAYSTSEAIASADLSQLSDTMLLRVYAMAVSQHYSDSIVYHDWDAPEQRLEAAVLRRLKNSRARHQYRRHAAVTAAPPGLSHGDVICQVKTWQAGLAQATASMSWR